MATYCADFESFYLAKQVSITVQGTFGYLHDPQTDVYLLSVAGDDGFEWVGHPTEFDWSMFRGHTVVAANAAFDEAVYQHGVKQGLYPKVDFQWQCVLDACSYLGIPRSLAGALKHVFKHEMSKTVRDNMSGKRWEDMTPEFQEEVKQYALEDARWGLKLWQKISPDWPEWEQRVSQMTRRMVLRGLPMDTDRIRRYIEHTKKLHFEATEAIPWKDDAKLKSRRAYDEECRKQGLRPPSSLNKADKKSAAWIKANAADHAWIQAFQDITSLNTLIKRYEAFERSTVDGRYCPSLRYCGTHTKRYSGTGGSGNILNMPRDEMFGTNLRSIIQARPGYVLVNADLAQIEIRTTLWLAGAKKALKMLEEYGDVYHLFAVMFKLWGEDQPGWVQDSSNKARTQVKPIGLGVTYGMSAKSVAIKANISLEEAEACVRKFCEVLPEVPQLWKRLEDAIKRGRSSPDRCCSMRLPSGNSMNYRDVAYTGNELTCAVMKGSQFARIRPWKGVLTENLASNLARDIIMDIMLRIDAKYDGLILQVYDEILMEVPEEIGQEVLDFVLQEMKTPPVWIPDIPLNAEGKLLNRYEK